MKQINLFEKMQEIVKRYMKAYQSDFEYDKEMLLDENDNTDTYYWIVRTSGTHLINAKKMVYKNDFNYAEVKYWTEQAQKVYEIKIDKRGSKYVYGSINEIRKEQLLNSILNPKEFKGARVKALVNKQVLEDIIYGQTTKEIYLNMLAKFKIPETMKIDWYILDYIDV